MFVITQHDVLERDVFLARMDAAMNTPEGIRLLQFTPAKNEMVAYGLWEAPSLVRLRRYLESVIGGVSVQEYHEVDEDHASELERLEVRRGGL